MLLFIVKLPDFVKGYVSWLEFGHYLPYAICRVGLYSPKQ